MYSQACAPRPHLWIQDCAPAAAPPPWRDPVIGAGVTAREHTGESTLSRVSAMLWAWRKGHQGPACRHLDSLHGSQRLSALFYLLHQVKGLKGQGPHTHTYCWAFRTPSDPVRPTLCKSSDQRAPEKERARVRNRGGALPFLLQDWAG